MAEIVNVRMSEIRPGDNDRVVFEAAGLRELADSLAAHGLAQPITVRPMAAGGYEIVAGERRWRAAGLLGWATIPAIVRELSDEDAAAVMLLENIARRDLSPIEEARAYASRRNRFGWSVADLAKHANRSADFVRRRLALLDLLPEVQQLVTSKALPLAYAEALIDLRASGQSAAIATLGGRDGVPSIATWRAMVGELLTKQDQLMMDFDLGAYAAELIAAAESNPLKSATGIERDARMPRMKRKGTVSQSLLRYVEELRAEGLDTQALAVATVLDEMVKAGWVQMKRND